jgi:hypothetical protein
LPLLRFCSSLGPPLESSCPSPLDASVLSWASLPFGASVPKESTCPRSPTSRVWFRVQGFSPSSRLTPPSASRVYFTPLTPFDFSLQGFPLPRSRVSSSLTPVPSCRYSVVALSPSRMARPPAHEPPFSRKRRRCLWPTSRLCSPRESVLPSRGFSTSRQPSPSWAFSLQGFPLFCDVTARHRHSFRVLGLQSLVRVAPNVPPHAALRSLGRQKDGLASLEAAWPS